MHKKLKTLLSATAVIAALAGGPALYAYADAPNQEGSGGMMQGGQGGMMNMMGQMSQMMETCNKMMQGMTQHHEPKAPKEGTHPEKEG